MPKKVKRAVPFPTEAEPVRPGETWGQYIDRLRQSPRMGPAQIAGIAAATPLMRGQPNAAANGVLLTALSKRLLQQNSFKRMTRVPAFQQLAREGRGTDLIVRMGEARQEESDSLTRYRRGPETPAPDAEFLTRAMRAMRESYAARGPAQRERESKLFREMLRRVDHARTMTEKGIPLDGRTVRELTQAVRRYNDGGTKIPGGPRLAAVSKESLCVLKRFLPEEEFERYCASVNRVHKALSPYHKRHLEPKDYTEELLTGGARTARDLMIASQSRLQRGLTLDGCALVTAVMELSGGNPNAVIRREELEAEVAKLKTPGSAFLRAMEDEEARRNYAELAASGKVVKMGTSILAAANAHTAKTAQWQINQAMQAIPKQEEGGVSVGRLADILAARELAATKDPAQRITNGAFKAKAEEIRNSPGFARLATQYRQDPGFRDRINQSLTKGDNGKDLEKQFQKANHEAEVDLEKQPAKQAAPVEQKKH